MIKNHGVENCMYKPEIKQKVQDTMMNDMALKLH